MAKQFYRCEGTFSTLMKNGTSRGFVKGDLYELDLNDLFNKDIRKSFSPVGELDDGPVESATAAPGERRDLPIMSAKKRATKKPS